MSNDIYYDFMSQFSAETRRGAKENKYKAITRRSLARDDSDVNSKNDNGETTLILAAKDEYKEQVRLILKQRDTDVLKDKPAGPRGHGQPKGETTTRVPF
jgi:ankyrin repeat protein